MNYFSGCRMMRELTDRCRTSLAAVSSIKRALARDAFFRKFLLLSDIALPILVGMGGAIFCLWYVYICI